MVNIILIGSILWYGIVTALPLEPSTKQPEFVCEFYQEGFCSQPENINNSKCLLKQEICEPKQSEEKRQHCYAFFTNKTGVLKDIKKGCWLNSIECYDKLICTTKSVDERGNHFCCCDSPMCNVDLQHLHEPYIMPTPKPTQHVQNNQNKHTIFTILCVSLLPLICIAIFTIFAYMVYQKLCPNGLNKHCFKLFKPEGSNKDHLVTPMLNGIHSVSLSDHQSNAIADGIILMEIKATRQFGASVKRGKLGDKMVAVKIFAIQEKSSYIKETEFYRLNYIKHENILNFIASSERKNLYNKLDNPEFWLITEFHERGSLHDVLKSQYLTWEETLKITISASKGLSFLHGKVAPSDNFGALSKPQIAHRDIKSRNILVKMDMTACIADFGLALVLDGNMGDAHCQVGTPRYMSPEVIEASIDCSMDNFLKIDVYAFGLVLWEVVSRCSETNAAAVDYKLPFELELGQHPSMDDMQKAVVINRTRPIIKPQWKLHKGINCLCQSMEELWDQDPEARNSMRLIYERLEGLSTLV